MSGEIVLHALAPGAVGGLESVVRALATGQRARGRDVAVALVLEPDVAADHPLSTALEAAGVPVDRLLVPPRAYLGERRAVARAIRRRRPAIVHCHGYRADVLARGPARAAGAHTVTTVHGFTGGGWKNRLYERLQRRAFRRFDAVVAVSRPLVTLLAARGVPAMRIHLIPNAWRASSATMSRAEAREVLGLPTDRPVVGWVGRLSAEKGPDVFVEALARTVDRRTIGCLVGDGRERADVERLGDSLGLGDRLRLPGLIADAARLYAAFDLFVLSSRTEGTPISLFEAMAARVPVVATAVGGVPDVVSADDALLVPPNAAAALARAIDASLGDPAAAADRASRAAARLVRDFGVDPWLDRYDALYASLARSPS
jgi:glycosyltransferase involved in cell wall biosynthesis